MYPYFLFIFIFRQGTDKAADYCPSAECWTFDDNTQECLLKDGCVTVDCKTDQMDIYAKPSVLGGAVQFAKVPGWTATVDANGFYSYSCLLSDGAGSCGTPTFEKNANGEEK